MNLYVQILSQLQSSDTLQMLCLPVRMASGQLGGEAKVSSGGKLRTRRFESVDELISDLAASQFNQLELGYKAHNCMIRGLPIPIESITGLFTPSASSHLWLASEEFPRGGNRANRTRRLNASAAETALSYFKIDRKPSILELVFGLDRSNGQEQVLDAFADWIAKEIPENLLELGVFGCADVGGPEYFVKLETNVLMTADIRMLGKLWPPAYPELGRKFDTLHPVMFGGTSVCESIAEALGNNARLVHSRALKNFSVIRLKTGCRLNELRNLVSNWMLLPQAKPSGEILKAQSAGSP